MNDITLVERTLTQLEDGLRARFNNIPMIIFAEHGELLKEVATNVCDEYIEKASRVVSGLFDNEKGSDTSEH